MCGYPVQVQRDPFARVTLMRRTVQSAKTCSWCGSHRTIRGRLAALFQYGWSDDQRSGVDWLPKLFCSIGCYRAYYERS